MPPPPHDIPFVIRNGIEIFLLACLAFSLLFGVFLGRRRAAARQRRSVAKALEAMGGEEAISKQPLSERGAWAASDFIVLEGTLEGSLTQKMGGADRSFPAQRQGRYALIRDGERIALSGDATILAGTFERFRLFSVCERRLKDGDRVLVKGKLKEIDRSSPDYDETATMTTYRTSSARRFALLPATGREEIIVAASSRSMPRSAKKTPSRLTIPALVPMVFLSSFLFIGATWLIGKGASGHAWDLALESNGDIKKVKRSIHWASVGAISPFDREWALNAIEAATAMGAVKDPAAQQELALLSGRFERYRHQDCRMAVAILETLRHDPTTIKVAEECDDLDSLHVAARVLIRTGEYTRASDLLLRTSPMAWRGSSTARTQLALEHRAHLLAGRLDLAGATLRRMGEHIFDYYDDAPMRADLKHWLPCAGDSLAARAGDALAKTRLEFALADSSTTTDARGICAAFLADLHESYERDELIKKFIEGPQRYDAIIKKFGETERLGIEAAPARTVSHAPLYVIDDIRILSPSAPLGLNTLAMGMDATEWRALDVLSAIETPSIDQRVMRMKLAADLASVAAVIGLDDKAVKWVDMLANDARELEASLAAKPPPRESTAHYNFFYRTTQRGVGAYDRDRIEILRAYVHLRAALGSGATARPEISRRSMPQPISPARVSENTDLRRELDGVLTYIETGALEDLRMPTLAGAFTMHLTSSTDIFVGLEIGARGSGVELAQWLDGKVDPIALSVALVASRRLNTSSGPGRQAMLDWLAHSYRMTFTESLYDRAAVAHMRAAIAENLKAPDVARQYREENSRILRGLMRRETSLAIGMTHAWR